MPRTRLISNAETKSRLFYKHMSHPLAMIYAKFAARAHIETNGPLVFYANRTVVHKCGKKSSPRHPTSDAHTDRRSCRNTRRNAGRHFPTVVAGLPVMPHTALCQKARCPRYSILWNKKILTQIFSCVLTFSTSFSVHI